jgi:polysaccharide biosynthesis transport protein
MDEPLGSKPTTLLGYLRILRRRKSVVLLAAVLVPAVAVVASHRQTPLYQSSAEVLLNRQSLSATLNGNQDPNLLQDPDRFGKTQAAVARSPALAQRVLQATGMTSWTPGGFLSLSNVASEPFTDVLLSFSVTVRKPDVAARLATAYATQYTIYRRQRDTEALNAARSQLQARIAQLRASGLGTRSSLYANLVGKEQALRTLEALQGSNASVVRPAEGAIQVRPRTRRNGILGAVIGIVLGLALAFLWEAVDRRVRSEDEVEAALGGPLLARVPRPPRKLKDRRLVMVEHPTSLEAESFRRLKTNLEFANLERGVRTIMVTSAGPREGKTTTIANLAVASALSGRRVALVDLDLRNPGIHRLFGLEGRRGVDQVALGKRSLSEAIASPVLVDEAQRVTQNGNGRGPTIAGMLEVLPAGMVPPDPGEFVASDAVGEILAELRERADLVLVDAPPILGLGDALALSARVDALFAVVRINKVRREMLRELARTLEACSCARLGYVITGANLREVYGYGGYGRSADTSAGRRREPVRG